MGRQLQSSERCGIPVQTLSLIREVIQKKFNYPDVRLHGPGAQTLLWKLRAAEVQPSRYLCNTVQYFDHNFLLKY